MFSAKKPHFVQVFVTRGAEIWLLCDVKVMISDSNKNCEIGSLIRYV